MAKNESPEEKKARETVDTIAETIAKLSRQVSAILEGRMKRESIIVLLVHSTRLGYGVVDKVLTAIEGMEKKHLK